MAPFSAVFSDQIIAIITVDNPIPLSPVPIGYQLYLLADYRLAGVPTQTYGGTCGVEGMINLREPQRMRKGLLGLAILVALTACGPNREALLAADSANCKRLGYQPGTPLPPTMDPSRT